MNMETNKMTTKNIQDVVASAIEKRVGAIITACFYNDGTKKSVTDVIDVEVPALVKELTQLVKEVEAEQNKRWREHLKVVLGTEIYGLHEKYFRPEYWEKAKETKALTLPEDLPAESKE